MVENKQIDRLIEGTAQRLSQLVDIDTVIGKPVYSSGGTEIIPLAKVTMGFRAAANTERQRSSTRTAPYRSQAEQEQSSA